jgi:hypothetical protein
MNRSRQRPRRSRRFVAVFATLVVFGALITITQVSVANSRDDRGACPTPTGPSPGGQPTASPSGDAAPAAAHDHSDATLPPAEADAQAEAASKEAAAARLAADAARSRDGSRRNCQPTASPTTGTGTGAATPAPTSSAPPPPLEILGNSCENSQMEPHDGFQLGNKCVSTAFGEVGEAADNPTLLISRSPLRVRVNQAFTMQVSTRNLVRNRFLAAKNGGYYRESAYLNEDGLVQGHFHTACRMLTGRQAPDPEPVPVFFLATEDGGGGAEPDVVTVSIPGLASTGIAQCAAWAGDGSHRVPMMQRANQIPAFDAVRIIVTR